MQIRAVQPMDLRMMTARSFLDMLESTIARGTITEEIISFIFFISIEF